MAIERFAKWGMKSRAVLGWKRNGLTIEQSDWIVNIGGVQGVRGLKCVAGKR